MIYLKEMKGFFLWLAALGVMLAFSGCIKEEALNSEADIVDCTLPGDLLSREAEIGNDSITLTVKDGTDVSFLSPIFTLTEGATIDPPSGTMLDFSTVRHYVVTSQDRQWSKRYAVRVVAGAMEADGDSFFFGFEHWREQSLGLVAYPVCYEVDDNGATSYDWASGNVGYALTGMASSSSDYPTHLQAAGHTGKCVELVTRSTGSFGAMAQKPLAAGNIFLGNFDLSKALSTPLEATQFGIQFRYEPLKIGGWMDYRPGDVFYVPDNNSASGLKAVSDRKDRCSIYAALYEVTDDVPCLTGSDVPLQSHPTVVCYAEIGESLRQGTSGWTYFEVSFERLPGRDLDLEKLKRGCYNLAVVLSSSSDGDAFEGAIGSCLKVDDVCITVKTRE